MNKNHIHLIEDSPECYVTGSSDLTIHVYENQQKKPSFSITINNDNNYGVAKLAQNLIPLIEECGLQFVRR